MIGPAAGTGRSSAQTRSRHWARAARTAANAAGASAASVAINRDTVGSDATWPNRSGWARTTPRSARQSPPNAIATARSSTTLPGSCRARTGRHFANCSPNTESSPTVRAVSSSNPAPADDSNDSVPTATRTRLEPRLFFTHGVPLLLGFRCRRKHQNPNKDRHFRAFTPRVAAASTKDRG